MKAPSLGLALGLVLASSGGSSDDSRATDRVVVATGGGGGATSSAGTAGTASSVGGAGATSSGGGSGGPAVGGSGAGHGGAANAGAGGTSSAGASDAGGMTGTGGTTATGGTSSGGTSTGGATSATCSDSYAIPPDNLPGWSPALSQSGAMTLTWDPNHSHDDQRGPLGFCPADVAPGDHYLALVSARFETDEMPPDQPCVTDFAASDATFAQYGMCWSGGNHNIYVEVRDASGQRVVAGFDVFYGTTVESLSDQGKPANEFPMNYAIYGDGTYGARATYTDPAYGALPSDAVTNMRMPIHHHVNYLLTFQVKTK